VLFSSRHPEQLKGLVDGLGPLARAGTVQEALSFGDVVFLAVSYAAYPQIGKDYARELRGAGGGFDPGARRGLRSGDYRRARTREGLCPGRPFVRAGDHRAGVRTAREVAPVKSRLSVFSDCVSALTRSL